jgi:hypothetical protein
MDKTEIHIPGNVFLGLNQVLSKDEEMAAIREALSRDYTPPASFNTNTEDEDDTPKEQVNYHDGATPLFLAIETTDWRLALSILEDSSDQARTWVASLGTVETTFNWALWRRLPIHEACRREAPAWLISALLAAFPESCKSATQFGELPLHLAVECGAPPEVVNLLVAAHWLGITAVDQSGRTPLEILNDTEMLAMEDHKVVFDSLTRSQQTYDEIMQRHEAEVDTLQTQHAAGLVAIRMQHDGDLQMEQEQQDKLAEEVDRLKELLSAAKETNEIQQTKTDALKSVDSTWRNKNEVLNQRVTELESRNQQETDRVRSLEQMIDLKDHEISLLEARIYELSGDLQNITAWQQNEMASRLQGTEQSIHDMVKSFVSLRNLLDEHTEGMQDLLEERGFNLPAPVPTRVPQQLSKVVEETKEAKPSMEESIDISSGSDDEDQSNLDDEFAMLSAAHAATSALHQSELDDEFAMIQTARAATSALKLEH